MADASDTKQGKRQDNKKRQASTEPDEVEEDNQTVTAYDEVEDWTTREDFELLRVYRGPGTDNIKAQRLHEVMSEHRKTYNLPEKPARTGKDLRARRRELDREGITAEVLRERLNPVKKETPRKKKKVGGR